MFSPLGNPNQTAIQELFSTLYNTLIEELYQTGARNFDERFHDSVAIDWTPFVRMQQHWSKPALSVKTSLELQCNIIIQMAMHNLLVGED
ncbi:hypothetical protein M422DRAFT_239697 [Sphaerobolus stellatus SS14]|nr:hypothetical protein M422DRAFT_239697 [Sphaerobolus stellatus SS14]